MLKKISIKIDFPKIVTYLLAILIELVKIAMFVLQLNRGLTSANRVVEVFNQPVEIPDFINPILEVSDIRNRSSVKATKDSSVVFNDVSFTYSNAAEASLQDINFSFSQGEFIGVTGSTGSGKSWGVAKLIEQVAQLPMANCILFDIHGEYSGKDFKMDGLQHLRVANPSDLGKKNNLENNVLMLPYWLLTYEEMLAMLLDRSDSNAPNQAMLFSKTVFAEKLNHLAQIGDTTYKNSITIDSPVPYSIENVLNELSEIDEKMIEGARAGTEKQGPYFGKLTRFVQRLEAKKQDKRLGFLFQISEDELDLNWMNKLCSRLMLGSDTNPKKAGVKIIDFSEVPSDILPLVIGLVARIVFTVQQWTLRENQHPIALFCDEAHLYIPERTNQDAAAELGLKNFERIAKEGRKYGVSLMVISQRPSEVNRTVLSQCNNFIALRLSNAEDQAVIKKLLPDNLSGLTDVLPILDIGEALVVGDASLLPTRILIDEPKIKPESATVKFWKEWSKDTSKQDIEAAVAGLRKQSKV